MATQMISLKDNTHKTFKVKFIITNINKIFRVTIYTQFMKIKEFFKMIYKIIKEALIITIIIIISFNSINQWSRMNIIECNKYHKTSILNRTATWPSLSTMKMESLKVPARQLLYSRLFRASQWIQLHSRISSSRVPNHQIASSSITIRYKCIMI